MMRGRVFSLFPGPPVQEGLFDTRQGGIYLAGPGNSPL